MRAKLPERLNPTHAPADVRSRSCVETETTCVPHELRPDARRFENWETNYAAKLRLGVAIDYALEWGIDSIWSRVKSLAGQLRAKLAAVPGVTLHDQGLEQCGIVTLACAGHNPQALMHALHAQGINVSVSRRSSTRLDMEVCDFTDLIRASLHYYNTPAEIDQFCAVLAELLRGQPKRGNGPHCSCA